MIYFNYYFDGKIAEETTNFVNSINLLKNKLKEKSIVNMTFVMYHDGIFYMRDKLFGKSFLLLSNMINEYCNLSLQPYLPHNGEVCLGKFPGFFLYAFMYLIKKIIHLFNI